MSALLRLSKNVRKVNYKTRSPERSDWKPRRRMAKCNFNWGLLSFEVFVFFVFCNCGINAILMHKFS